MKTIKINDQGEELRLIETAEELPIKRFMELKALVILKETGVNVPVLHKAMSEYITQFDQRSHSGMLITLYNYVNGLNAVENGEDADQLMYALIVLEKDEDLNIVSTSFLKEKLDRFSKLGLTQKEVQETVENFIKGSPVLSQYYFLRTLVSLKKELTSSDKSETLGPTLENSP